MELITIFAFGAFFISKILPRDKSNLIDPLLPWSRVSGLLFKSHAILFPPPVIITLLPLLPLIVIPLFTASIAIVLNCHLPLLNVSVAKLAPPIVRILSFGNTVTPALLLPREVRFNVPPSRRILFAKRLSRAVSGRLTVVLEVPLRVVEP
ncbi:hypothetical protein Sarmat_00438 [Rickettsiales endosymbiont of Paramecium tredecaurelia]|nr:hypothetical protein [Candidatus Sarmatiella mevalonica]